MKNIRLESHTYVDLPIGTKLVVPNPKWDYDKPNTHFYLEVETVNTVCVELSGSYTVKIVNQNTKGSR